MSINVQELVSSIYSEPIFYVNFYKIARPSSVIRDDFTYRIQKTNNLLYWRIQDEQLTKVGADAISIFFDYESYIIQWMFDLKIDNTLVEELLVYHWKGQNAAKGYSPLPPEVEDHCPVERVVQWSEPALFFHGFPNKMIAFTGRRDSFNPNKPHLLLALGEVVEEIHFYEIPCEKQSLRSRATFLLIMPKDHLFLYWHGVGTSPEHRKNVVNISQPHQALKRWQKSWLNFSVKEIEENNEIPVSLDSLKGSHLDYHHLQLREAYSPKLFYLNSITGNFLATEVEYPLRATGIAPFPFLQSHLYTAIQPALFLLDNNAELWLWEGIKDLNYDVEKFKEELTLAKDLLKAYALEKEKVLSRKVVVRHVYANKEPLEFKNMFPFWNQ